MKDCRFFLKMLNILQFYPHFDISVVCELSMALLIFCLQFFIKHKNFDRKG